MTTMKMPGFTAERTDALQRNETLCAVIAIIGANSIVAT